MTAETIKTIAAFGGLLLGLLNLTISLYKDFFRKGKLEVYVESAVVKHEGQGTYKMKIDLIFTASGGDVFLKDIFLVNAAIEEFGWENPVPVLKLAPYVRADLLTFDLGEFYEKGKEMLAIANEVRGLKIADKTLMPMTCVEVWDTPSSNSTWHQLPRASWIFRALYGKKLVEVPFSFVLHPDSLPE